MTQALHERILSGELPTGVWLRQERVAAEYGISRTPVREALRALQALEVIEIVRNRGAVVRGPDVRDLREAYAVRAELEGFAAELAARWITDEQLARLWEAEELFRATVAEHPSSQGVDSVQRPRWSEANDLFHEVVLEASGNSRLAGTVVALHRSFPRNITWLALSRHSHLLRENVDQHREVLQAIAAHDSQRARQAMAAHVHRAGELIALEFEAVR